MTHTTQVLADFVMGIDARHLPPEVTEAVKDATLDLLASAAAGWTAPMTGFTRRVMARSFAPGPSDVWFAENRLQPEAAAMINSTAASALDLDDGHRGAAGHPGAAIVPCTLATAQAVEAAGHEIIAAMVAGYEIAARIGAARDFSRLDTMSTGRWSAYGAVAAAGRLKGVNRAVLAQAFSIAGVLSPGLSAAGYSTIMGNQVKEGIPWSVLTGLCALELAREGMTGPLDILDHPNYFDARAITRGLGDSYAINGLYFKPYACCRWIHAAIDALLALMARERVDACRITALTVHTFERALRLNNYPDPPTIESAQYSLPFCLALAALKGADALLPIQPVRLTDQDVVALARRVRLAVDPTIEQRFPAETGARVVLDVDGVKIEQTVRFPLGDPANPMGRARLIVKFHRLADGVISTEGQGLLLDAIATLETQTVEALVFPLRRVGVLDIHRPDVLKIKQQ